MALNSGGGGNLNIVTAVLGNMRLGALGKRLFTDTSPDLNRRIRAELAAAGATVDRGNWRLPDTAKEGQQAVTTNVNRQVINWLRTYRQYGPSVAAAPPSGGGGGGGGGTVGGHYDTPTDAEWAAREAAIKKSPQAPPAPPKGPTIPDKYPMPKGLPPIFRNIWASVIAYAVMWALPYIYKKASESWQEYFDRWQARENAHRNKRRKPGGPGQKPPRATPRAPSRPGVPTSSPTSSPPVTVIVNYPAPAPAPAKVPDPGEGLYVPVIWQRPIPMPAPLPAPAPTVSPWIKWGTTLAPFVTPLLSSLTQPGKGSRRMRDPLTVINQAPLPSTASYVFGGGGSPGSNTCACKPKKKGRKKKRTVCYSGTYTEKASGLRKTKRRKVPCK